MPEPSWLIRWVTVVCAALPCLAQPVARPAITSHVTVISANGKSRRVIYSSPRLFEAPNWSRDGQYLLLNSEGRLWRLALAGGEPQAVDAGAGIITRINNDHGISPDGMLFAFSAGQIYTVSTTGGQPRQLTRATPSYFHGWSPDGKTLAFCAQRNGNFDIYSISASGGEEKRLTSSPAYDDGPDYSPDGKWIYFNSDRSGSWDIWRMPADGAGEGDQKAERVTSDDLEDWFPHPSPNGRRLVFISFPKGTKGHPANQNVVLRSMPLPGDKLKTTKIREIVRLFGGQGTMNVNSWSPDSKRFAYISYTLR